MGLTAGDSFHPHPHRLLAHPSPLFPNFFSLQECSSLVRSPTGKGKETAARQVNFQSSYYASMVAILKSMEGSMEDIVTLSSDAGNRRKTKLTGSCGDSESPLLHLPTQE